VSATCVECPNSVTTIFLAHSHLPTIAQKRDEQRLSPKMERTAKRKIDQPDSGGTVRHRAPPIHGAPAPSPGRGKAVARQKVEAASQIANTGGPTSDGMNTEYTVRERQVTSEELPPVGGMPAAWATHGKVKEPWPRGRRSPPGPRKHRAHTPSHMRCTLPYAYAAPFQTHCMQRHLLCALSPPRVQGRRSTEASGSAGTQGRRDTSRHSARSARPRDSSVLRRVACPCALSALRRTNQRLTQFVEKSHR
jgi:hypothetical protein